MGRAPRLEGRLVNVIWPVWSTPLDSMAGDDDLSEWSGEQSRAGQYIRWRNSQPAAVRLASPIKAMGQYWFHRSA